MSIGSVVAGGVPVGFRVTWDRIVPGLESIPADIIPLDDATYDLGSADSAWANIYADAYGSPLSINDPSLIGNPQVLLQQNGATKATIIWRDSDEILSVQNNVVTGGGIEFLPDTGGGLPGKLTLTDTLATFAAALAVGAEDAITASTTQTQGQQPLTKSANRIATVANANDVVTLPVASAGRLCAVRNDGANTLQIFPASGGDINGGATDASTTLAAGSALILFAIDATSWYSFGAL